MRHKGEVKAKVEVGRGEQCSPVDPRYQPVYHCIGSGVFPPV